MKLEKIKTIIENECPLDTWHYWEFGVEMGVKYSFRRNKKFIMKINNKECEKRYVVIGLNYKDNTFHYSASDFELIKDKTRFIHVSAIESLSIIAER